MSAETHRPHLTDDEIERLAFPAVDGPAAVLPAHLAACPACAARVRRLQEAVEDDRSAIGEETDRLDAAFWARQREAIGSAIREPREPSQVVPIGRHRAARPVLVWGSLAASVALVLGLSLFRPAALAPLPAVPSEPTLAAPASTVASAATSTGSVQAVQPGEPALSGQDLQDHELLLAVGALLREESPVAALVPEGGV